VRVVVQTEDLGASLNADDEFRLRARFWNGALQLEIGEAVHTFGIVDGEVVRTGAERLDGGVGEVIIRAPHEDWYEFVQPIPRALHHELYPAMLHHGFDLAGDPDHIWPYYGALRRVGELVRQTAAVEEG